LAHPLTTSVWWQVNLKHQTTIINIAAANTQQTEKEK
jgi:hypothetical protein